MSSVVDESKCLILEELMKHLKSDSKTGIIVCLSRLKCEPKSYKLFAKNGGLGILVNLLCYHNLKILNMTLSILANACMTYEARDKVRGSKINNYVVHIIKTQALGNSLHCRACRLIGNLSELESHAKTLCDVGAIQALTSLLQEKANMQTYLMAVRAIRNIWLHYMGSRGEILESGVIKNITLLLVLAKDKAGTDRKYLDLVDACLKAMYALLLHTFDPRCGQQMRGKHAEGYKCIIECCNMNNKMAMKCLYNLCEVAECRPLLGSSGAIEYFLAIINKQSKLVLEDVVSLCLLCREAVNRARIKVTTGLELILALLKKPENDSYYIMLLQALAQFVCDDLSIKIMIKNGLLDILVTRLKDLLEETVSAQEKQVSKKRANDSPPFRKIGFKYRRTSYGRFSSDYPYEVKSPNSTASVSSSPPSTPPLPFQNSNETDENTEDNYSPVCSDTEWVDNEEEHQEEVESLKSCKSSTTGTEEETHYMDTSEEIFALQYEMDYVLVLLSRLSYSKDPIERLADPMTIKPLSAYIKHTNSPRACRILTRILRNPLYFVPLVKQGFVFEAQTLSDCAHYKKQLWTVAETGGAIGQLCSILQRGEDTEKLTIALSIPYLINSYPTLKMLLNNYGAFQLMFSVLKDHQHELFETAICSISHLAHTLRIQPEIVTIGYMIVGGSVDSQRRCETRPKSSTVTFELDDGTTVDACRKTLCQLSDAFNAMLEGSFSESGKRRVKLKNTSAEGLNTLILAVSGAPFHNRSIESMLDAVLLADKFLMPGISDALTEKSISMLNYKNFSRAWMWAKKNFCTELKLCCVKNSLTAEMTMAERIQVFRDFSACGHFQEFVEEVKALINGLLWQP
ncbi:hypothetical protein KM043_015106 [Ampulex compressa]|nr:hypothetical protein KM043_015106 [Ampulex compressa]